MLQNNLQLDGESSPWPLVPWHATSNTTLWFLPFLQQHVAVVCEIPEHHIVQVKVEATKLVDEQQSDGISCVFSAVVTLGKDWGVEKVF